MKRARRRRDKTGGIHVMSKMLRESQNPLNIEFLASCVYDTDASSSSIVTDRYCPRGGPMFVVGQQPMSPPGS